MRSFIAIDLKEKIREKILEKTKELKNTKADLKFVEKENLHLTLKFLGDIGNKEDKLIRKRLKKVLQKFDRFKISLEGAGVFPNFDYIKVIWIGVKEGSERVKNLNKRICEALSDIEIKKSRHEYTPHITFARMKSGRGKEKIEGLVKGLKGEEFGKQKVEKIHLKKSELKEGGPVYSDLRVFKLQ